MCDNESFQELKEKEIKRLTSPLTYKKSKWGVEHVYDCEGNPVRRYKNKYVLEPNNVLLSNEEIIKYSPDSIEASRSRLKLGIGRFSDKLDLYGESLFCGLIFGFMGVVFGFMFSFYIGVILLILILIGYVYFLFIHDFTDNTSENININVNTNNNLNMSYDDDLLLLFESKEKIAREMIERKFPAPQLTNSKFNSVLDNCRDVIESQVEILNALTPNEKTKYEIDSRKKLIKRLISKIDDLTNELILSEENDIEDVIDEMDQLIGNVKNYK